MKYFSQQQRVIIWLGYLNFLIFLSYCLFSSPFPPTAEKGIWFYSCLASIILGDLITNPFFTSPADVIANTTAAMISLLAVYPWFNVQSTSNPIFWLVLFLFIVLMLSFSICQIIIKDSIRPKVISLSQVLYKITSEFGNHKVIFSSLVVFSLYSFHRDNTIELFSIGLISVLVIAVHPIERIWKLIKDLIHGVNNRYDGEIGEIVGYEYPNMIRIKSLSDSSFNFGDPVMFKGDQGKTNMGCVLDQIGFTGEIWYRVLTFSHHYSSNHKLVRPFGKTPEQIVCKLTNEQISDNEIEEYLGKINDSLIGIVAPNSDISRIIIELVRTDVDLKEGRLVKTEIGSEPVLFQIINGLTREEIIEQKNNRGYVHAEARKLGTWENNTLKSVHWVPMPNTPVFIFDIEKSEFNKESIGFLPSTNYQVSIDVDSLVTHNAAILGILGIGKTCLALELIERMIKSKLKVICLDITDEYKKQLECYINEERLNRDLTQLTSLNDSKKDSYSNVIQEGGSVSDFKVMLRNVLHDFLIINNTDWLQIYNPANFKIWKQAGGIYNRIAPMALLTPCEITKIISEITLEIIQQKGLTNKARCCLVYEEAHSLVPEWNSVAYDGDKAATNASAKAILQGRKYGLGCLLITQRTANVTKSILNQCNTVFALRTLDSTGIDYLKDFVGNDYASLLATLEDRHAIVFGKASSSNMPVIVHLNDRNIFLDNFREGITENDEMENSLDDIENSNGIDEDGIFEDYDDDEIPF